MRSISWFQFLQTSIVTTADSRYKTSLNGNTETIVLTDTPCPSSYYYSQLIRLQIFGGTDGLV